MRTSDAQTVGDLRDCRHRLRVRHLRNFDAAAHRAAGPHGVDRRRPRDARVQLLGGHALLGPGDGRRHIRADRRLSGRPLRPPAHPRLEHPALRRVRVCLRGTRPRSGGCCSSAARPSSASVSSSWPPSPGSPSCFPTRNGARPSWATRRRSRRLAASWSRAPIFWRSRTPTRCLPSTVRTLHGDTR